MSIVKALYGSVNNRDIFLFTLENANGVKIEILNYGGIVRAINVPDRNGNVADIVLGYDTLEQYTQNTPYFGAIVGRCANVIEDGIIEIDGVEYTLSRNEGEHHQHGGVTGFNKVIWDSEIITENEQEHLQLSYQSHDGEEGYPGNLSVKVVYSLLEDNSFCIDYSAVSDKNTVVNMTNHTYFNLNGHGSSDIADHELMIYGDKLLEIDERGLPTGKISNVSGTVFDFLEFRKLGQGLKSDNAQIVWGKGFDHNWILQKHGHGLEKAGEMRDQESGRSLEVFTTMPGMQFYTGNYLDENEMAKAGCRYKPWGGFCLETQYFPNAFRNKVDPMPLLKAGDEYKNTTIYKFNVYL